MSHSKRLLIAFGGPASHKLNFSYKTYIGLVSIRPATSSWEYTDISLTDRIYGSTEPTEPQYRSEFDSHWQSASNAKKSMLKCIMQLLWKGTPVIETPS